MKGFNTNALFKYLSVYLTYKNSLEDEIVVIRALKSVVFY